MNRSGRNMAMNNPHARGRSAHAVQCIASVAAVFMLSLALQGCSGFTTKSAAVQDFVLQPAAAASGAGAGVSPPATPTARTLSVLRPVSGPGLAGTRIAVLLDGGRLDGYRDARWAGDVAETVQGLLIATLRNAGVARSVFDESAPFNADWLLRIEVQHFESVETSGAAPGVHVAWQATLGRRTDRTAIATLHVDKLAAAGSRHLPAIMAAFQQASNEAAAEVASWTAGVLAADAP